MTRLISDLWYVITAMWGWLAASVYRDYKVRKLRKNLKKLGWDV